MFDAGGGDEAWGGTPPPAADRVWRHPSEMRAVPSSPASRPHRFSLGTVVVAGSLGALAMFGSLVAAGLVGGTTSRPPVTTSGPDSTAAAPTGVVSVRVTATDGASYGSGLVFNTAGDVVTTVTVPPSTSEDGPTVSVSNARGGWTDAVVLGADPLTGVTVIRPAPVSLATARSTPTAGVERPVLGQTVDLVRPGAPATVGDPASGATIASTTATFGSAAGGVVGLVAVTSTRSVAPDEVVVTTNTGAVAALLLPGDDDPDDRIVYAVPATTAVAVARRIETTGHADHATLGVGLGEQSGTLHVTAVPAGSGLAVGDELVSVAGRPVRRPADVTVALLETWAGGTATVTVRRNQQPATVRVRVVGTDAVLTGTTVP